MNPFLAITVVLLALSVLIGGVKLARLPSELSRKAVHVGMGLVCLSFPWLFEEKWPVFLLALIAIFSLSAIRFIPAIHARFGAVLGGVSRRSWGELYFPLAVAIVFALSGAQPLVYIIPILQLTVADAVGALIGVRYGGLRYQTDDGEKSAEGSTAFFITAFLAAHLPLLLFSSTGRLESILVSILLALILMLMEAISWRGLDNLFIPITCYVFLQKLLPLPAAILFREILLLLAVILIVALWRRRTHLSRSASVGASLVLYAAWLLGGWPWLLGPFSALAGYTLLCPSAGKTASTNHSVEAVFAVAAPGLFWLYAAMTSGNQTLIYPYGIAFAVHLGMIAAAFFLRTGRRFSLPAGLLLATALAFLCLAAPYWIVWRRNPHLPILSVAALGLLLLSVGLFIAWQPQIRQCPTDTSRWIRQGSISAIASGLGLLIILFVEPWTRSIF